MYSLARLFLSVIFKASTILSSESCLATELRDLVSNRKVFFLICLCCGRVNSNCMVQMFMCSFPDCMIFFFRELLSNWTKKEGVSSPESCTEEWSTDKVCVFFEVCSKLQQSCKQRVQTEPKQLVVIVVKVFIWPPWFICPCDKILFFFFLDCDCDKRVLD